MGDKIIKKIPSQTWTAWGFLWVIYAMNANGREILNRVAPYIINEYHVSATQMGLLSTLSLFGLAAGSVPLVIWADKGGVGYKRVNRSIVLGLIYLTSILLCGFNVITGAFSVLFILHVIKGFFSGAGEAVEVGMMMEWVPREKTGFFAGLHHTGYPWGTLLGGILVTIMLTTLGDANWRSVFIVFPVIGYIAWFAWKKYSNKANYQKFEDNCRANGYHTALGGDSTDDSNFKPAPGLYGRIMKNPNLIVMVLVAFCCLFGYAGINFWLTPYITFVGNFNPAAAASLSVVFTITGGLGQVFWGNLSDKIGSKTALLICTAWLVVAFWLMQFAGLNLGMLIGLQLFMGFALNAVYAMIYKFVAVSSEKGAISIGNSLIVVGMYVGGGLATYILGAMIDAGGGWAATSGYMVGLYTLSGVLALAFVLTLLFTRETNGPRFKKDFSLVSLKSCNLENVTDPYGVREHK
jgi:MFS family permease